MNGKRGTGDDDILAGLNIVGRALINRGKSTAQNISAQVKETINLAIDPNERFKRAVKTKYDSLRRVGFDEDEARKMAITMVERELDRIKSSKGGE